MVMHPDITDAIPLNMIDPTVRYPAALPPVLARWYAYLVDLGHCIMVIPAHAYEPHRPADGLVPIPVSMALEPGAVELLKSPTGHLLIELDYDAVTGKVTDERIARAWP